MPNQPPQSDGDNQNRSAVAGRFLRFVIVGGLSSLLYVVFVIFFVEVASLSDLTSVIVAYLCATPLNYIMHRKVTFRSRGQVRRELPRFLFIHTCNIGLSLGGMQAATTLLGFPYWVGAFSAAVIIPISSFILMQIWVFVEGEP